MKRRKRLRKRLHKRYLAVIALSVARTSRVQASLCEHGSVDLVAATRSRGELARVVRRWGLRYRATVQWPLRQGQVVVLVCSTEFTGLALSVCLSPPIEGDEGRALAGVAVEPWSGPSQYDWFARWSYDRLILSQPHLDFRGLYRCAAMYFAVCDGAEEALTSDGDDLQEWFQYNCVALGAAVDVVSQPPPGALLEEERSAEEWHLLVGSPRRTRDLLVELMLRLSRGFPDFGLSSSPGVVTVITSRVLTPSETRELLVAYGELGSYPPLDFSVNPKRDQRRIPFRFRGRDGDIALVPSRHLPRECSASLRMLVEDDDDFWNDARRGLASPSGFADRTPLAHDWRGGDQLQCVVDGTTGAPRNLRTYLSLYQRVMLAVPFAENFEHHCEAMGVTPAQLTELVAMGRLRILLPQAIDRYPVGWLSEVAGAAPDGLLLSRRLAAAVIVDARQRIPFLFPPLGPTESYRLLHWFSSNADRLVSSEHGCASHPEHLGAAHVGHAATGRTRMCGGLRTMSIASSHRSLNASARI